MIGPERMSPVDRRESTFTTGDGTSLHVVEQGATDAAVTVVLVHGWTLGNRSWERVAAGLPEAVGAPVRILRFDLRGHGDSAPAQPGSATIDRCADDLAELIADRVPRGPIVLAGHSMGGMTLMALAERHGDLIARRVAGVGFIATSSGDLLDADLGVPRPVAKVLNGAERLARRPLSALRRRRVSRFSGWLRPPMRWLLFGRRPTKADVAATAAWVAACYPANIPAFRIALAEHERTAALPVFSDVPAVVLAGTADRLCPHSHADRIARALPHARLYLYSGAGHLLPLERDAEVTARLAELIRASAGRATG